MDKTLDLKKKEFGDALKSLEEVLEKEKDKVIRDSVIKRFEYSFESCWKMSKRFLYEKLGVVVNSPKECFRELGKNKLISPEKVEKFLLMTDDRNESIHNYSEEFSEELYGKIKNEYASLLRNIFKVIEQ